MTADTLTTKQRAHLRSLAHHLKPILHIGKEGVSDTVVAEVLAAFNTRELYKVKVLDSAPEDARDSAATIADRAEGVHVIQVVGKTIVLYRPHPEKPKIKLPRPGPAGTP